MFLPKYLACAGNYAECWGGNLKLTGVMSLIWPVQNQKSRVLTLLPAESKVEGRPVVFAQQHYSMETVDQHLASVEPSLYL